MRISELKMIDSTPALGWVRSRVARLYLPRTVLVYSSFIPQNHITELCYRIMLQNYATESCYRIMLQNHATELIYRINLQNYTNVVRRWYLWFVLSVHFTHVQK